MNWGIITIIITIIVPPLTFYLIQEVFKRTITKAIIGILGFLIVFISVVMMRISYGSDIKSLNGKIDKLLIEKLINSIWLHKIVKLTTADYIESAVSFEVFVKFYVEHPTRYLEINNYKEDLISNEAIKNKLGGFLNLEKDRLFEAIDSFNEALRIEPNYYTAKLGKAMVYRRLAYDKSKEGNVEETSKYLIEAKKIYEELQITQAELGLQDLTPFIQLAFCYVFIQANYEEAEGLLIEALKMDPHNGEAFNLLGLVKEHQFWVFKREKYIKEAEKSIKIALCFYNYSLMHGYGISKINKERLEEQFYKIELDEVKEIAEIYMKKENISYK